MKTLLLLLLVTTLSFGQSDNKVEKESLFYKSFVRVDNECELSYIKLYIGKRRIVLQTNLDTLDLRVIKKEKFDWTAKDKDGAIYHIKGMVQGNDNALFLFGPKRVMLSSRPICD